MASISGYTYIPVHMRSIANAYYEIGRQVTFSPDNTDMGFLAMEASHDINLMLSIEFGLKALYVEFQIKNNPQMPMTEIKDKIKKANHHLHNLLYKLLFETDRESYNEIINNTLTALSIEESVFKNKLEGISNIFSKGRYYFDSLFEEESCKIPYRLRFNMVFARLVNEMVNKKIPITGKLC